MNSYSNDYSRIPGSGSKHSSGNTSKKIITLSIIGFYIVVGCFFLISILAIILYYNQSNTTSSKSSFNTNLYSDTNKSSYSKLFNVLYSISVFIYIFITMVVAIMAWNKTQVSYSDSIQLSMSIVLAFTTILTLLN